MTKRQRPDVTIPQFSRIISHNPKNVHIAWQWVKKGWLEFIPGKPMLIRRAYAIQILRAWRSSCTLSEFTEMVGVVTKSWIGHVKKKGQLRTIRMFVFRRILRSEVLKARALWEKSQEDVVFPEKKGWARYSLERRRQIADIGRIAAKQLGRTGGISTPEARKVASDRIKRLHKEGRIPYMNSEQARKIGKKGGRIAQARGTAHRFTNEERQNGRLTQRATPKKRRAVRKTQVHRKKHQATESALLAPLPLKLYRGENGDSREIGSKRLVTYEEAGRFLDRSPQDLTQSHEFHHLSIKGVALLWASQVEAKRRKEIGKEG